MEGDINSNQLNDEGVLMALPNYNQACHQQTLADDLPQLDDSRLERACGGGKSPALHYKMHTGAADIKKTSGCRGHRGMHDVSDGTNISLVNPIYGAEAINACLLKLAMLHVASLHKSS